MKEMMMIRTLIFSLLGIAALYIAHDFAWYSCQILAMRAIIYRCTGEVFNIMYNGMRIVGIGMLALTLMDFLGVRRRRQTEKASEIWKGAIRGRMGRGGWLGAQIVVFVASTIVMILCVANIERLYDVAYLGWMPLAIPIAGWILALIYCVLLLFTPGKQCTNEYGRDLSGQPQFVVNDPVPARNLSSEAMEVLKTRRAKGEVSVGEFKELSELLS
jgi:hypothetical protein